MDAGLPLWAVGLGASSAADRSAQRGLDGASGARPATEASGRDGEWS
jgi:hypothetical protein